MKINLVFIIMVLILIVSVIIGGNRGLLKGILSLGAVLLSWALVAMLNPYITKALQDTAVESWIEGKVSGIVTGKTEEKAAVREDGDTLIVEKDLTLPADVTLPDGTYLPAGTAIPAGTRLPAGFGIEQILEQVNHGLSVSDQSRVIENLPVPDSLRRMLEANNNQPFYEKLGVDVFTDYLTGVITRICINIIAFILTLIAVSLIFAILSNAAGLIDRLPLIHGVNHFCGAILGLVKGLFWIEFLLLLLIPFAMTPIGQEIVTQISQNSILTMLYEHNVLLRVVAGLVGAAV